MIATARQRINQTKLSSCHLTEQGSRVRHTHTRMHKQLKTTYRTSTSKKTLLLTGNALTKCSAPHTSLSITHTRAVLQAASNSSPEHCCTTRRHGEKTTWVCVCVCVRVCLPLHPTHLLSFFSLPLPLSLSLSLSLSPSLLFLPPFPSLSPPLSSSSKNNSPQRHTTIIKKKGLGEPQQQTNKQNFQKYTHPFLSARFPSLVSKRAFDTVDRTLLSIRLEHIHNKKAVEQMCTTCCPTKRA